VAEIPNLVTEERMDLASSPNKIKETGDLRGSLWTTLIICTPPMRKNAAMNIVNSMPGLPAVENANPCRGRSGAVTF
jgi:hypothetical protein